MAGVQNLNKKELALESLPIEILRLICEFVGPATLFEIAKVNKAFARLISQNQVWQTKLKELGITSLPSADLSYKKIFSFISIYQDRNNIPKYIERLNEIHKQNLEAVAISEAKKELIENLRQYITVDRCQNTDQLKGVYWFKNKIQTWFSWFTQIFTTAYTNFNLTSEQKKDLAFFNRGTTEVARASTYFEIWQGIDKITDLESMTQFKNTLIQFKESISNGRLLRRIEKCLQSVNDFLMNFPQKTKDDSAILKQKHLNIKTIINNAADNLITQNDSSKREVITSYQYFQQKLILLEQQKEKIMSIQPELEWQLNGSGFRPRPVYQKGMGKNLTQCSNEIFDTQESLDRLYNKNTSLIDSYISLRDVSVEKKLSKIKEEDENLYYSAINNF